MTTISGGLAAQTRWMDATDQADLLRSGEVSAAELLEAAIERIEALDPTINAVAMRWFDHARATVAAGLPAGPFTGVPFLLKDFVAPYAGQPESNGNIRLKELALPAPADSTLVARLRAAGLVTAGRTTSPEFAALPTTESTAWGRTRNPWLLSHSTGGSSGGATAAVAAGMVPIAQASDGSGSIRIPAALCGLVGLKPSRGRISAGPYADESGPAVFLGVSRTVRDTAALLDAVHGPGVGDLVVAPPPSRPYVEELRTDPRPLRIGVLDRGSFGVTVHPEIVAAVASTARLLESLGHHVELAYPKALEETALDDRSTVGIAATSPMLLSLAGLARALGRDLTPADMEPLNWERYQRLLAMSASEHVLALAAATRFRRSMLQWWADGFDLLLTPTTAMPAAPLGTFDEGSEEELAPLGDPYIAFTRAFNITGQPAISLPAGRTTLGLPIGAQLVADHGREDVLLAVAAQLERARPWKDELPAL
ncbi:amidase [Pseudonocardia sp. TRM90224]|uniref:amidase n=1 Tax=Pseudonocardia sp. TRM90224 TaxID=2812678 RepID=UPI001E2C41FC|nr:amidase [Pseudonocardia sp. TRM90224]